jgi:hypothetical protein
MRPSRGAVVPSDINRKFAENGTIVAWTATTTGTGTGTTGTGTGTTGTGTAATTRTGTGTETGTGTGTGTTTGTGTGTRTGEVGCSVWWVVCVFTKIETKCFNQCISLLDRQGARV